MILSRLWVLQGLSDRIAYCVPLLQLGEGGGFSPAIESYRFRLVGTALNSNMMIASIAICPSINRVIRPRDS